MADAVAPQGQVAGLEPIAEPMAGTASAAAATAAHGGAHDAAPAHASASAHPAPQAAAHGNKLAESHGESVAGGDKAPEGHADKPAEGAGATAHAGVTWQSCREALFAQSGALAQLSNPFDPANTVLGTKCEKRNAATRGLVLVEKGVPPPPGTTGAMTWAVLEDGDLVAKGLQLRIQVCDAGGYLLKVAEVKL